MSQDLFIELVVRERCKNHKIIIDRFTGSPESVMQYLSDKYVSKNNLFSKISKVFSVTEEEMNLICGKDE